jgi:DNA end-binding protein Ku
MAGMKTRCLWSGHLKLSLVTIPVRVYSAVNAAEKLTFHHLHKGCHQRIRQKLVCPVHGEVLREDLVKGYEYAKDSFVVLEATDLAKVRLETTGTIELVQFIGPDEPDPLLAETPYYLGSDGPVAEEGFAVVVKALSRAGRIGIGRVVLGGKEKLIALKPMVKGFVFFTLRPVAEVRAAPCWEDLSEPPLEEAQVCLAQKLIESKSAPFNPSIFTDRYHVAVLDLIKTKMAGTEPMVMPRNETAQVISFVEALRQSVAEDQAIPGRKNDVKTVPSNGKVHKLTASPDRTKAKQPRVIKLASARSTNAATV